MTASYGPHPLRPLNTTTRHGFDEQYKSEQLLESLANGFIFYFDDKRHKTNGSSVAEETKNLDTDHYYQPISDWKIMKDRQKTVSAALLLCLNLGVDPPDVVKTNPCARIEAGIDALNFQDSKKAIEQIGKNLQAQYETLSLRTRFKQSLDPCVEDVKRFCNSLRRTSKEDRILFHYNGHGVPKPTPSGEIWVFNRGYTQYIPVSLYDLQTWLGAPCIYVYDCNSAGNIVTNFQNFVQKRIKDDEDGKHDVAAPSPTLAYTDCFQLASCRADELLVMSPELPADLFTCCLTSPIDISVKVFLMQSPLKYSKYNILFESSSGISEYDSNAKTTLKLPNFKVPGLLSDRRTPLGELNWVFTAITDTIAWTSLPRPLFKKLFRHDLMVAALFRNFLLAKRIMPWYNCHPVSDPSLPDIIAEHPIWKSWDLAMDEILSKLVDDIQNVPQNSDFETNIILRQQDSLQNPQHKQSVQTQSDAKMGSIQTQSRFAIGNLSTMSLANHPSIQSSQKKLSVSNLQGISQQGQKQFTGFFEQNLTAFELWLKYASNTRNPPEQLPIVLQVLLSQVHRIRALVLLSRFLDLGPWAVYLSLSIGIFPYVLKLLQSPAPELKPILVFIWARIMAIDYKSIQADLLKERGYMYFVNILVPDWNPNQSATSSSSLNNSSPLTINAKASFNENRNQSFQQIAAVNGAQTGVPHHPNETTDEQKAMAVFILSAFIRDFSHGQKQCFGIDLINRLYLYIQNSEVPLLRQWSIVLIGQFCHHNPLHKFICMELNIIDAIVKSLNDPVPEVRAVSLLALSEFISDADDVEILLKSQQVFEQQYQQLHSQLQQLQNTTNQQYQQVEIQQMKIEHQLQLCQEIQSQLQNVDFGKLKQQSVSNLVATLTLIDDGSPLVRKEIIMFFSKFVNRYINFFIVVAFDILTEEIMQLESSEKGKEGDIGKNSSSHGSIFSTLWKALLILAGDPYTENRMLAGKIIDFILYEISLHKDLGPPFLKMNEYLVRRSSNLTQGVTLGFNTSRVKVIGKNNVEVSTSKLKYMDDEQDLVADSPSQYFLNRFFSTLGFKDQPLSNSYPSSDNETPKSTSDENHPTHPSTPKNTSVQTHEKKESIILPLKSTLLDYCYEYFQEPQMRKQEVDEPGSIEYNIRLWRRSRNEKIIEDTQIEKRLSLYGDWSHRMAMFDNKTQPKLLKFAQFENYLVATDERDCITVYDWNEDTVLSKFSNNNPFSTKITSLTFLNEDDSTLLLSGSSDGIFKIYKDFQSAADNSVVSAWRGLSDMLLTARSSGLLTEWQQIRGSLLATGDVKVIRIWDAHTETVEIDIPAKTSALVTSITSDQLASDIFVCGFVDGSLRIYDRRIDPRDAMVRLWRSGNGRQRTAINNVQMQRGGYRELVSGTTNGTVELWDIRSQEPVNYFSVSDRSQQQSSTNKISTMTSMQLHEHAPIIATGTKQISLWTTAGDLLSSFNNIHNNNSGGVAGTLAATGITSGLSSNPSVPGTFLSSLAFHPHKMMIAASNSHDSRISIYNCQDKRFDY